jgi:hypothetical protein
MMPAASSAYFDSAISGKRLPVQQVGELAESEGHHLSALWDPIGTIFDTVAPEECNNHFRHAGYGSN